MKELTARQKEILRFLRDYRLHHSAPPTMREIMDHFEFKSIRSVQDHLLALEKKGQIKREREKARSISLLDLKRKLTDIIEFPVIGTVPAGTPLFAEENIEGYIAIDKAWVKGDNAFVLKVYGKSMMGAGIYDGDFVIVRKQSTAENGEIVVAMINDEATLKRFYKHDNRITLKSENPAVKPFIYHKGDANVSIVGKVVGVFRKYC